MKIAVCVKQVPEGTRRIDPQTKRLDRSGEGALNPFDANAVEEALRLKDAGGEGEIVLVSMGPAKAQDALRKALAMGADRAVLVSDEGAAGADLVATSAVLAKALARENADLILFGQQANDSDGAVLWAAVADRMRLPVVSQAAEITHADVLARLVRDRGIDTVLFANSVLAADIAAGLAARLDAGVNWDLVDIAREDAKLVGKRPALQDTVYVDVGWTSE